MITRKLGAILRGKATPFQLVAACVLGAMLGFAPGLLQGPALVALLVAALLVVNANLGLALLFAGLAKIASLLLAPVSFHVGRFLLDGPTEGLAKAIVNAPVLAWCGLQYYAIAGGQLLALVIGLAAGLLLAKAVGGFRRKMVAARDNPGKLSQLSAKPGARFAIWLFFGGKGKKSWEEKLGKKVGNPVRIWGAALIVLLLVGAWLGQRALAGPLARRGLQAGLERANGATADVGQVDLELDEGRFAVAGLALADPNALDTDLFRADRLEADVDNADLLRRRIHVAKIVVSEAKTGAKRETPGVRTQPPAEEVYEEPERPAPGEGDYSLEDVLADVELWKERLAQARGWLDRLSGLRGEEEGGEEGGEAGPSYSEELARRVREQGWFTVAAEHLTDEAPTFRLSELVVDGLDASWLPDKVFDLRGQELSTNPALVDAPPRVELASRDGTIAMAVDLAPASRGGGDGALRFSWKGLSVDETMAMLKIPGKPLSGGTLDLAIDGSWLDGRIGWVDLPLKVTLHDTVLQLEGMQPTSLDELELPIGLSGPIDSPRVRFESSTLVDALTAAGKKELANRLRGELQGLSEKAGVELPEDLEDVKESVGDKVGEEAKGLLDGFLGGKEKGDG